MGMLIMNTNKGINYWIGKVFIITEKLVLKLGNNQCSTDMI